MEQYDLKELTISDAKKDIPLVFSKAVLTVVSEYATRLWYIEVDGVADSDLLQHFAETDEIGIGVRAVTREGGTLSGEGYFHPNPRSRAAAIRGDGELRGYSAPG